MNFCSKISPTTVTVLMCVTSSLCFSRGKDTSEINGSTLYMKGYNIYDSYRDSSIHTYEYEIIKPPKLLALVANERSIYMSLDSIRKDTAMDPAWNTSDLLSSVAEYLEDYEKSSLGFFKKFIKDNGDDDYAKVVSSNMLTVFLTVRRFRNYIQTWLTDYAQSQLTNIERSLLQAIKKYYKHEDGPERYEFHLVQYVIMMAQFQLDLKAKDIASGKIGDSVAGVELNANESMGIALHALVSGMYPIAIEWLELIVEKISSGDKTLDLDFAKKCLQIAKYYHDEHWKPEDGENLEETFFVSRLNESSNNVSMLKWNKQAKCEEQLKSSEIHLVNGLPYYNHWNLCNGAKAPEFEKSRLFCWYEREVHPSFKIGPFKAELHSVLPHMEVVQYYDVISSDKLERLKSSVRERYTWAGGSDGKVNHKKQISALADANSEDPVVSDIEAVVGRMTGLKMSQEDFVDSRTSQVGGYIAGGHAIVHEDWNVPKGEISGVRSTTHSIATVMLYLEAPEHGGQTTFPYPLVAIQPTKGSAIVNYNLLSSGEGDIEGCHGACPLISGEKYLWIKDITYTNQYNFKCNIKRDARIEILVNGKSKYRTLYRYHSDQRHHR